ncbi:MAG: permease [Candidatus Pacebacteria bacterium CG10_big_fil_rev_8_21_14_0_10_56_10]|nr:MAG: permease [Candidatus Pacebacteria bacterium CG10_big_fil_rev_8_21_14_0_10_56_10]
MLNFTNIFSVAVKAIWVNKVRSLLTMLGIIIGVGSVVLLTSIGNGLRAFVTDEFNQLGANTLIIFPNDIFGDGGGFSSKSAASSIANSKLKLTDVTNLQRLRDHVTQVAPFNLQTDTASFRTTQETVTVLGTTFEYAQAFNTPTERGSFFSKSDDATGERVVVLGFEVANQLFGQVDPIGKRIKIGGQSYQVVGVAEKKGSGFGGLSFDTYVYVPLRTFFRQYDTDTIIRIIVKTPDTERLDQHLAAIEAELGKRLDDDEFSVVDQSEILGTITQILGVLTLALGGISAISLVVGGIGIMNIMLVSVTERTREIGLRKALGATPNVILLQFLIEAALLSVMGGGIGIGLAFAGTLAVQVFIPAVVTPQAVALAFGVSTLVGLVFGVAPARRAAQLSPIEALRYE